MTLVMVVDDDQDLAEMLSIVLNGAGIDVSSHPEVIKDLMDIAEIEYNPDVGGVAQ